MNSRTLPMLRISGISWRRWHRHRSPSARRHVHRSNRWANLVSSAVVGLSKNFRVGDWHFRERLHFEPRRHFDFAAGVDHVIGPVREALGPHERSSISPARGNTRRACRSDPLKVKACSAYCIETGGPFALVHFFPSRRDSRIPESGGPRSTSRRRRLRAARCRSMKSLSTRFSGGVLFTINASIRPRLLLGTARLIVLVPALRHPAR